MFLIHLHSSKSALNLCFHWSLRACQQAVHRGEVRQCLAKRFEFKQIKWSIKSYLCWLSESRNLRMNRGIDGWCTYRLFILRLLLSVFDDICVGDASKFESIGCIVGCWVDLSCCVHNAFTFGLNILALKSCLCNIEKDLQLLESSLVNC